MWFIKRLRENEDFELTIVLLQYAGLWPTDPNAKKQFLDKLRHVGISFSLVFMFLSCTVFYPLGALVSSKDVVDVCECVGVGSMVLVTFAKVSCCFLKRDNIKELTSRIVASSHLAMTGYPNEEKQKISASIQWWINFFVAITVVAVIQNELGFGALIPSMFAKKEHFGRLWFPIDPYSSPTYEIVFAIWVLSFFIAAATNICVDGLLAATFMQLVGQYRLLRYDIARVREDAVENLKRLREEQDAEDFELQLENLASSQDNEENRTLKRKYLELNLHKIEEKEISEEMTRLFGSYVSRYQENAWLVHEVERLFAPMLLAAMVVTVIAIVAIIFFAGIDPVASEHTMCEVEKEKRRKQHLILVTQYSFVVLALFFELGFACFLTNLITEESELVREAAYACDWLASTSSFKKSMRIIMSRANQPVFVKAAGFVPMTLETFLRIINLAFSYYTALKSVVHGGGKTK